MTDQHEHPETDRADCGTCAGDGWDIQLRRCPDCLGTGKELTREDFLRAGQEPWDPTRFRNHAEEIEAARAHAIAPLIPEDDATGVRA